MKYYTDNRDWSEHGAASRCAPPTLLVRCYASCGLGSAVLAPVPKFEFTYVSTMLHILIAEFRELFDALVCTRLHPRDVTALSTTCRDMRALHAHPMTMHVRTFVPVLRSLRAQHYAILGPNSGYSTDCNTGIVSIYRMNDTLMSVRDTALYQYFPCDMRDVSAYLYVLNGRRNIGTCVASHRDRIHVGMFARQYEYEFKYAWILHSLTLMHICSHDCMRVLKRYIDDIRPLTYACRHAREFVVI